MVLMLMAAGIVAFVGGAFAIASGVPIKEFSFGNTIIIAGAVASGAGLVLIGLSQVVREVRNLSATLAQRAVSPARPEFPPRPTLPTEPRTMPDAVAAPPSPPRREAVMPAPEAPVPGFEQPARESHEERFEDAGTPSAASPVRQPVPSPRNLLFRPPAGSRPEPEALPHPVDMPPDALFDAAWPPRPAEGLWKRRRGAPDPSAEQSEPPPETAPPAEPEAAEPTAAEPAIIKSGVIEGMGYTLYSDGSIETQLGEGVTRFASIEALRIHLDRVSASTSRKDDPEPNP